MFCRLLLGQLSVKLTWWYLGSDGNKIRAGLKISELSIKISHQIYAAYFLIYCTLMKFSVFVLGGSYIFQNNTPYTPSQNRNKDPKCLKLLYTIIQFKFIIHFQNISKSWAIYDTCQNGAHVVLFFYTA